MITWWLRDDREDRATRPSPATTLIVAEAMPKRSLPNSGAVTTMRTIRGARPDGCYRRYRCAAQAYMLISMPTCTSTIFGVFQTI
jgi:hypothetical protein